MMDIKPPALLVSLVCLAALLSGCEKKGGRSPAATYIEWLPDSGPGEDIRPDRAVQVDSASDLADLAVDGVELVEIQVPESFDTIMGLLMEHVQVTEGDWAGDEGHEDATGFGPAVLVPYGLGAGMPEILSLGRRVLEREMDLIDSFSGRIELEALVGGLGLLEAYPHLGETALDVHAKQLLEILNGVTRQRGMYLDDPALVDSTYSPTMLTALVAILNLSYSIRVKQNSDYVDFGLALIGSLDDKVHVEDRDGGFYRSSPSSAKRVAPLLPNAVMMLCFARAYGATGDSHFRDRSAVLLASLQRNKIPELSFHDPTMGHDHVPLIALNYLMSALEELHRLDGDAVYLEEMEGILGFIEDRLLHEGRAWLHWADGGRSSLWCSGCNLQLLGVLWRARGLLEREEEPE